MRIEGIQYCNRMSFVSHAIKCNTLFDCSIIQSVYGTASDLFYGQDVEDTTGFS